MPVRAPVQSSRQFQKDGPWGFYCADETAARYNASSPRDTQDGTLAYALPAAAADAIPLRPAAGLATTAHGATVSEGNPGR
jgi:hypothetical protein